MPIDDELLEPLKLYNYELSYKHQENVESFFDELAQKSGVDIEENQQTCKEYYALTAKADLFNSKLNSSRTLKAFLIVLTVLLFLAGTILIVVSVMNRKLLPILLPIGIVSILSGVFFIILNVKVINKRINNYSSVVAKLRKEAQEKKNIAEQQMACLNALYDWNIPSSLVTKTAPIIQMDKNVTVERVAHIAQNYGWKETNSDNVSTIFIQSGTIVDNPFLYERDYVQVMRDKVYEGSLVITWTTTTTDSKGNTRVIHHTQTLIATVTRPASYYYLDTALIYANEAAPKLSFSRNASNANSMSEKEIEKGTQNFAKKLVKMQEKGANKSFTALGNDKFEYLFNALNRDNEVEFRLLFTPLAQKNMLSLITSKQPYGDDFKFVKKKMINVIHSSHAQLLNFDGNPYHFYNFDYDKARNNFIRYNMNYFQGIFYDFAPLLSIPLYQQHRDYDVREKPRYKGTVTMYEAEVLANFMEPEIFKPDLCDTNIILKASLLSCNKDVNIFDIHSYGYQKIPQVEIVPKVGRDGLTHGVPVHYFDYEYVEKHTNTVVINVGGTKQSFNANRDRILELISNYSMSSDIIYQRGMLSFPLKEGITTINGDEIKKLLN